MGFTTSQAIGHQHMHGTAPACSRLPSLAEISLQQQLNSDDQLRQGRPEFTFGAIAVAKILWGTEAANPDPIDVNQPLKISENHANSLAMPSNA